MSEKIILASQSPRRKQLLEWAEVEFEIVVQSTDEWFPPTMPVEEIPIFIARNKAIAVSKKLESSGTIPPTIVAADTVVVLDNKIIGKPIDRNDAVNILLSLSGKQHLVITGVVIRKGVSEIAFGDITKVWFNDLTREELEFYVDKYKPYDKAGAYAIQEWIGVVGIKSIEGDFYNVMGLPVSKVVAALRQING
jgi:septum formation protein